MVKKYGFTVSLTVEVPEDSTISDAINKVYGALQSTASTVWFEDGWEETDDDD